MSNEIRGMKVCDNYLYVVAGNTLWRISPALTATDVGVMGTDTGQVKMADNGSQVMIVDDEKGYLYSSVADAFYEIRTDPTDADPDFPENPRGLGYMDGYFVVSKRDTGTFWISKLYDGTSWDALDFASAEGSPDMAVDIIVDHRELWIFGEESTEVFYNAGNVDFPFVRTEGAFIEVGIASKDCAAKLDNSVYWLTNHGTLVRADGYNPQVVSTRQVEHQWCKYDTIEDARAFAYHWQGHAFYQITFPSGNATWVYDASNGSWHKRASYPNQGRHRANCYAFWNDKHLVGDFENGRVYELDLDTYTDNLELISRMRTTPMYSERNLNIFCHSLQIDFEAGTGLNTGQGLIPQAMLQMSDDGGHTWSNEYWVTAGKIGEYDRRAIWQRLGVGRNRTLKLMVTDPVKWNILGATANITVGTS